MGLGMTPRGQGERAREEAAVFQRLSCKAWDRWGGLAELQQGWLMWGWRHGLDLPLSSALRLCLCNSHLRGGALSM